MWNLARSRAQGRIFAESASMSRRGPPPGGGPPHSSRASTAGMAGSTHTTTRHPPQPKSQIPSSARNHSFDSHYCQSLCFLGLARVFDGFAQSRPELRLTLNLGLVRVYFVSCADLSVFELCLIRARVPPSPHTHHHNAHTHHHTHTHQHGTAQPPQKPR